MVLIQMFLITNETMTKTAISRYENPRGLHARVARESYIHWMNRTTRNLDISQALFNLRAHKFSYNE